MAYLSPLNRDRPIAPESSGNAAFLNTHTRETVSGPTAGIGLGVDASFFARLRSGLPICNLHLDFPQHPYDLLWFVIPG